MLRDYGQEARTLDNRACWDCDGIGLVTGSLSLRRTESELCRRGWRFLEAAGRIVCPECAFMRRHGYRQVRLDGL
jgi:hypothetical protein